MEPAGRSAVPDDTALESPGPDPVLVSLVIPCLNEEQAIGRVVRKGLAGLAALGVAGEVLVVDNDSSDGTATAAREAGARVVQERRRGYGRAYQRGFAEARGKYIVMADGDDTYPVDDLKPFIELLERGCDMVNGNRLASGVDQGAMTWSHRYLGTPALSWLLRWVTGTRLADSQCGMRAFRKDALARLELSAPGMEFASEMLVKAAWAGLRLGEVPITLAPRVGDSKLQTLPDGWRHLRYLLVASPDHLFLLPGIVLFLAGLALLGVQSLAPAGVPIGNIRWEPRFAPVIRASIGTPVLWFGLLAKIYYASLGILTEDRLVRWFLRVFSLERALGASLALILVGLGLEVALALQEGLDFIFVAPQPLLGAAGAFATVVGIHSFFSSFLAYLMSSEYTRRR
jgi:glycosyltransferase involved in cell wall biosynthesis